MSGLRFGSVCSGIEAASVAWEPLGWEPVFYSEIDKFPSAVLEHRFPRVPNLGDMNRFQEWPDASLDLLVGGTPCQSFSVAGLRGGLADPRGNLALVYLALAARYRPRWILWENVPGVLSSGGGRDFGSFLGGLGELGYGWAYRVLDAQFFGVPQRRRRVFVVGHLGDWRRAAEVLFEPASLRGDSPPSRAARQDVATSLASRTRGGGGLGTDAECDGALIAFDTTQITSALNRNNPKPGDPSHPLAAGAHAPAIAFHNRQDPDVSGEVTHPLGAQDNGMAVAIQERAVSDGTSGPGGAGFREGIAYTLEARPRPQSVGTRSAVRRLTPRECERLQGFPDDWTLIPYRGKPAADGPRYKALGNSMAVPVMRWIGERIARSEELRR